MNSNHSIACDPNFPILRNCSIIRSIRRPYPCLQHIKQYGHKSTTAHIQKRQTQKGGGKLKSWVPFSSLCSSTKTFTTQHLSSNIQTVTNQINQRTEKLLFITKTIYSLIIIRYKNSKRLHVSTHKSMACHNKTSQFNLQLTF